MKTPSPKAVGSRKPAAARKAVCPPMMTPGFFAVMDEMLARQRRDRRRLARQIAKKAS